MSNIPLSKKYPCKIGGPVLHAVDRRIFTTRYFQNCMGCNFCHDICCEFGVDVDMDNVARLRAAPQKFKDRVGYPENAWFTDTVVEDAEFPSGRHVRTQVHDGLCVFRNRVGRGCLIHAFALEEGGDYHDMKPLVSILFPLTFEYGVLMPSNEALDGSLICSGAGPSCYDGSRDEVIHYFGEELARELDALSHG